MRRLEATLRQDLLGVTARLTPPLDPKDNLGCFEYGENAFADAQGEDSDDYLWFTAKAPEGQPFTGRYWNPNAAAGVPNPIIISSEYAEILYFLRNGNLYRRVLLIVPELKGNLATNDSNGVFNQFSPLVLSGATCGWLGVNDISAHPDPNPTVSPNVPPNPLPTTTPDTNILFIAPVPNTLGDLTNRENRFARPRFTPYHVVNNNPLKAGIADDYNSNGVPDYYPTLYPNAVRTHRTVPQRQSKSHHRHQQSRQSRRQRQRTRSAPFPLRLPRPLLQPPVPRIWCPPQYRASRITHPSNRGTAWRSPHQHKCRPTGAGRPGKRPLLLTGTIPYASSTQLPTRALGYRGTRPRFLQTFRYPQ